MRARQVLWAGTVVCVGLQALLAILGLWTVWELATYGEVARRPTYTWTGVLVPLATAAGAVTAAASAWRTRRPRQPRLRVIASEAVVLAAAGMLALALPRPVGPSAFRTVLLEPGSRLPPNEIYGSESALGAIVVPVLAAGALAVPALALGLLLAVADRRRDGRRASVTMPAG